jgi:alkylation response protein AidB-like acyl-CoA dehydrogenase
MSEHSVPALLARIDDIRPIVPAHAAEADRLARLPDPLVTALNRAGLFRIWIPRRHGGFELSLPDALRVYEAAASLDGSLGWAVMIGSGGGLFAAVLDEGTAQEIYAPSNAVIAGSGAPDGRAERVPGGFRATGRWRYASGAHYATTFTANCIVTANGEPVTDADGTPLVRALAFEPSQVTIVSAWDAIGMRGTGSHDFEVSNAFVAGRRTFSVFTDTPREPGPLYQLPFDVLTQLPVASVALGIAQHALDAFAALDRRKREGASDRALASDAMVQSQYAQSHARWRAARARVHELAQESWAAAVARRSLAASQLAEIAAGCALVVSELGVAVASLAALAGMSAILRESEPSRGEFARAWRDLQTLSAHVSVSSRQFRAAGATFLGAE